MQKQYARLLFICGFLFSQSPHVLEATSSLPHAQDQKETQNQDDQGQMPVWMIESEQAAKDYVSTLDKGQYAQSWSKGDSLFQQTITQDEWERALNASRKGLGSVKTRVLNLQRPAWNPHGLPQGPYMVIEYTTSFAQAPHAIELLTLRRGDDGKWRVLTYQVK